MPLNFATAGGTVPPSADFAFPRFDLGRVVSTPGAQEALCERFGIGYGSLMIYKLLLRHQYGDWGDLEAGDKAANEQALRDETRIFSAYQFGERDGEDSLRIWIITEWDRSYTTVLLPEEY